MINETIIDPDTGLTFKERAFAEAMARTNDPVKAAVDVGFQKSSGKRALKKLLAKPEGRAYIASLRKEIVEDVKIDANMVLTELARIGFSNIQDYIKEGFTVEEINKLKREHAAAIESVNIEITTNKDGSETQHVRFKLYNKLEALEKIAKHLGFYEADNKQQPPLVIPPIQVFNNAPPLAASENDIDATRQLEEGGQ